MSTPYRHAGTSGRRKAAGCSTSRMMKALDKSMTDLFDHPDELNAMPPR
ncbi:MAG: hypothetical protein R3B46_10585 [Phycisphaerales bacterium]